MQAEQQIQEPQLEQKQEIEETSDALEHGEYLEEVITSVEVGPVKINYGNIWLDVFAGTAVVILVVFAYYWKKKIDKKFK
jgi:hypothetical protein